MQWLTKHQTVFSRVETSNHIWVAAFIVLFVSFFVTWLLNFPSTCTNDSFTSFKIILGEEALSNAHPIFYTMCLAPFILTGNTFGSLALGVALYSLVQLILCAAVYAYVCYWLKKMGAPTLAVLATLAFFAFNPIIVRYATTIWKDIPFSLCMLIAILQLFEIALSKGTCLSSKKTCTILALSSFLACLLRNNGLYATIVTFIFLIIAYRLYLKRILLIGIIIPLTLVITGSLYTALGVQPSPFRESVSIPIQQVDAVVAYGGDLTDSQRETLSHMVDLTRVTEKYLPYGSNPVKFDETFSDEWLNKNKSLFLKTWLEIGVENPILYAQAWLQETRGYWNIETTGWAIGQDELPEKIIHNALHDLTGSPFVGGKTASDYTPLRVQSFLSPLFTLAVWVWFVIGIIVFRWVRGQKQLIIPLIPLVALWGTLLIAAPFYCEFRYLFAFHITLPVIAIMLFARYDTQKQSEEESKKETVSLTKQ